MKYDSGVKCCLSLAPKSQSGAAIHYGTGVDTKGFQEAIVELIIGTMATSSTYDVKVQESSDDVTYTDITGAAFSQKLAATGASALYQGRIKLGDGRLKYLRVAGTDAVGAVLSCANIILCNAKKLPITPQNTLGFDV